MIGSFVRGVDDVGRMTSDENGELLGDFEVC